MRWLLDLQKNKQQTEVIGKKTYTVMGKDVTFSYDHLPWDMKSWPLSIGNYLIQQNTFPVFLMFPMITVVHLLGNME